MKWFTRERPTIDRIACPWRIDSRLGEVAVGKAEIRDSQVARSQAESAAIRGVACQAHP